ncbi:MAG TPA: hypothetical protein VKA55_02675 [Gammaproteobacteria bacterium]|nr:hypothetical protein [Gammaproteobacteria bacterium]
MIASDAHPFKGFAHPLGSALTLSARGHRWTLTIETADGGPYPPFQDYHQQGMDAAEVRRFIHGSGRDWEAATGDTGRDELVAMDNGFRVRLTPALDTPLDAAAMVAELEGLLQG